MRPALLLLWSLLLALSGGCRRPAAPMVTDGAPPAPKAPPELAEIERLEDARRLGNPGAPSRLLQLADHPTPAVRRRALTALGRLGEPVGAAVARGHLADDDAPARRASALALELIGDGAAALPRESERIIVGRLSGESDEPARRRLVRALGRLGDVVGEGALRGLLEPPGRDPDAAVRAEALRALAIHGVRGRAVTIETRAALQQALTDEQHEVRRAAAQALHRLRCRDEDVPSLTFALRDREATVRAAAARALATASVAARAPLRAALGDGDWRVRVEVARALAPLDRAALLPLVDAARAKPGDEGLVAVALAALEAIGAPPKEAAGRGKLAAALARQVGLLPTDAPPGEESPGAPLAPSGNRAPLPGDEAGQRSAGVLRCALDALRVRLGADDEIVTTCAPDAVVPAHRKLALRAAALGERWDPRALQAGLPRLVALASHPDGRVRAAALAALAGSGDRRAVAAIQRGLDDPDAGAVAAACEAVTQGARERRPDREAVITVAARLLALDGVGEVEAVIACLDALRALEDKRALPAARLRLTDGNAEIRSHARDAVTWLAGAPPSAPADDKIKPPPAVPGDPAALAGRRVLAHLDTLRGSITLELFADETPRTVAAFVDLAQRGFYDGLVFHRVVPNFVIQGGDPRGDGFGGPGFTLRDEPTGRRFERGTVGIALAGKDTGGSQIFICQADAPHLEGKFTAFGRVASGLEIVDRIVVGDPIRKLRLEIVPPIPLAIRRD